jgi:chemotaxis protein CheX
MGDCVDVHIPVGSAERAVRQLFQSMLDLEIAPTSVDQWGCVGPIIGIIHLSGGWEGFLLTGFEPSLAEAAAARMMAASDEPLTEEEVRDTVGEIANILAGNLKCLIPGWTQMSMPAVVEGTVSRKLELKVAPVRRFYFTTVHGRFWLTLVPSGQEVLEGRNLQATENVDEPWRTRASGGFV